MGRNPKPNQENMTSLRLPVRVSSKLGKATKHGETKAHALERILAEYSKTAKNLNKDLQIKNRIIWYFYSYCREKYEEKNTDIDLVKIKETKFKVLKWLAKKINSENLGTDTNAYIHACAQELSISEDEISEIIREVYESLVLLQDTNERMANTLMYKLLNSGADDLPSKTPLTGEEIGSLLFLFASDYANFLDRNLKLIGSNKSILDYK